jgi:Ca-activated chloride channel family protein
VKLFSGLLLVTFWPLAIAGQYGGPPQLPGAAPSRTPPSDVPPIRVNVRLVNVFVNVTDTNGAPVGSLTQDDFTLTEDGHPQKISVFERQSEMPLTITLAIDTSGSVHKDLPIEQRAAHKFVHTLLRPVDRLSVVDFSSDVREVQSFTNNLRRIDDALENLRTGPATALYNAIYLTSQTIGPHSGRKVLVVISDGGNTVKGVEYDRALEAAIRADAMVYSIIDVPIEADAGRDTGGEHAMISLSQETGGKYYYANASELDRVFQQVSDDLRTQYLLGYYPTRRVADSNFRAISVHVRNPQSGTPYNVRNRTGYYAAAQE